MKKFAVLMALVLTLSVFLTACSSPKDSGKVCDVLISPDKLEDYAGQKVTLLGSHAGVTVLNIGGKHVCVSNNGLYSTNVNEQLYAQVRIKTHPNQYRFNTVPLGYDYSNMYSGMTGKVGDVVSFSGSGIGPVIIFDKTLEMVYQDSCTVLDDDSIGLLNGQKVKATGMWVPVGEKENQEYDPMMAFEYKGQSYCYDGWLWVYKTTDVFGEPHHILYDDSAWVNPEPFLFGDTGVISVEPRGDGLSPDVFFDVGEGEREVEVDPMVEEIGSRGYAPDMYYLMEPSWYGDVLDDGQGNVYSLISWEDAPQLIPGYFASPKSYTYGGLIDKGVVMGEIGGKPLVVSSIENLCEQVDNGYNTINFVVSLDGEDVGEGDGLPIEYFALIKGNGAGQDITYFKFDANEFCQK